MPPEYPPVDAHHWRRKASDATILAARSALLTLLRDVQSRLRRLEMIPLSETAEEKP